jgi:FkbM family methyltransferase
VHLRPLLKEIRGAPPVNWPLTHGVRAAIRATGRPAERLVQHLPRSGRVKSLLPNGRWARFRSRGDDGVANHVFWHEWHGLEPEQTVLFYEIARQARVTLDVGAHVGFYSVLAGLANETGRVYAFEPLPSAFERLQQNVALNGLANVQTFRMAAADSDAEAEFFHLDTGGIPSSSSLSRAFMTDIGGDLRTSTVPTVRLDSLLAQEHVACVDLVKLDTETTEAQVLGGMREALAASRPAIFCEVLPTGDGSAITSLLEPLGYRFFVLTAAGPQERASVEPVDAWRNWLFACGEPIPLRRRAR